MWCGLSHSTLMLNYPFRHLNLNIEMEVASQYQCTVNTREMGQTKRQGKQTNPDSLECSSNTHPVSLAGQIQREGKAGYQGEGACGYETLG